MKHKSVAYWFSGGGRWPLAVFVILYVPYSLGLFILTAWSLDSGVRFPGVDSGFLVDAFMYHFPFSLMHLYALLLLSVLLATKTSAKGIVVIAVVLPIISLYVARALITAHYPMMIYTW